MQSKTWTTPETSTSCGDSLERGSIACSHVQFMVSIERLARIYAIYTTLYLHFFMLRSSRAELQRFQYPWRPAPPSM